MQVFLSACSHILSCSPTEQAAQPYDDAESLPEASAEVLPGPTSVFAQTAAVAAYATRIAFNAVLRISRLATPEIITAAFPLEVFIADVLRLQNAAFSSMHLPLEVLVATLKGAGQAEIEGVLPQLMRFTVGSSERLQVRYILYMQIDVLYVASLQGLPTADFSQQYIRPHHA